jgi:hypothetical protein
MGVDVRVAEDARDRNEIAAHSRDEVAVEVLAGNGVDLPAGRCARPSGASYRDHGQSEYETESQTESQ